MAPSASPIQQHRMHACSTSSPSKPNPNSKIQTHHKGKGNGSGDVGGQRTRLSPSPSSSSSSDLNIQDILLGDVRVRPWYSSFYPEELVGSSWGVSRGKGKRRGRGRRGPRRGDASSESSAERSGGEGNGHMTAKASAAPRGETLFVCPWCFKYAREVLPSVGHAAVCSLRETGPPGVCIYESGDVSILELDGEDFKLYTQNLSLFAKLFLDTKSVFYDTSTFLYYLLVYRDPYLHNTLGPLNRQTSTEAASPPREKQGQVVGFFSKEKLSWDNNNLACILVFPPWQRRGLGQVLMDASYALSRWEGRVGGPEKPLSEPGRRGYLRYWSGSVARCLLGMPGPRKVATVTEISNATCIAPEDVIAALKEMGVLDRRRKGNVRTLIDRTKVKRWMDVNGVSITPPVDQDAFVFEEEDDDDDDDDDDNDKQENDAEEMKV